MIPLAFAEEKIIDVPVTIKTNNNELTMTIQGGNSYTLNCSNNQQINQTLQTKVNVNPGNVQECQDDVDKLSSTFVIFTQQFNKTLGGENCLDILGTNKVLAAENGNQKDKISELETAVKEENTKFYDMWKTCDNKRSELQTQAGQNTACQSQLGETKKELDNKDKNKWLYYIGCVIIGAVGMYIKNKIDTDKGADGELGR